MHGPAGRTAAPYRRPSPRSRCPRREASDAHRALWSPRHPGRCRSPHRRPADPQGVRSLPDHCLVVRLVAGPRRSLLTAHRPDVQVALHRVLIDLAELGVIEGEVVERGDVLLQLCNAAGAEQHTRHTRITKSPRDGELGKRLTASLRDVVQSAYVRQVLRAEHRVAQRLVLCRTGVLGHAVEVLVGEHTLRERRERDAADALAFQYAEQLVLDPAVQHRVRGLVDEQRRTQVAQDRDRLARTFRRVRRDARVPRLAGAHCGVERTHRLLERRIRVEAVAVEDVDVIETHPAQRVVEARQQVLARAEEPVRTRPHVPAGLGGDDQLVTVRGKVLREDASEVRLRSSVRRAVVVGEIEVGDAEVERPPQDRPLRHQRFVVTEVVPQPERDRRQLQATSPATAVRDLLVAVVGGTVEVERPIGHTGAPVQTRSVRSAIDSTTRDGRYGNLSTWSRRVLPLRTRTLRSPASRPAMMSVSIRSPTMTVVSECASIRFSALRIISGLGLPTKYGSTRVALVINAATDPVAGMGPPGDGPVGSGLVAMNRAPASTSWMAFVMASNEYVRVSPSTT